jgi:ribonuclease HI
MKGYITVFADASFCPKSKASGIAFWCRDDNNILQHSQGIMWDVESNGEAELVALCSAIDFALRHLESEPGYILVAQSDCLEAIEKLDGDKGSNLNQVAFIAMALSELKRRGVILRTKHVKGHTGKEDARSYVNRWCDHNARKQMRHQRNQKKKPKAT